MGQVLVFPLPGVTFNSQYPSLPCYPLRRHVAPILIFLWHFAAFCANAASATFTRTEPSVADLFPASSSWVNPSERVHFWRSSNATSIPHASGCFRNTLYRAKGPFLLLPLQLTTESGKRCGGHSAGGHCSDCRFQWAGLVALGMRRKVPFAAEISPDHAMHNEKTHSRRRKQKISTGGHDHKPPRRSVPSSNEPNKPQTGTLTKAACRPKARRSRRNYIQNFNI
jgi:hypothetical protein